MSSINPLLYVYYRMNETNRLASCINEGAFGRDFDLPFQQQTPGGGGSEGSERVNDQRGGRAANLAYWDNNDDTSDGYSRKWFEHQDSDYVLLPSQFFGTYGPDLLESWGDVGRGVTMYARGWIDGYQTIIGGADYQGFGAGVCMLDPGTTGGVAGTPLVQIRIGMNNTQNPGEGALVYFFLGNPGASYAQMQVGSQGTISIGPDEVAEGEYYLPIREWLSILVRAETIQKGATPGTDIVRKTAWIHCEETDRLFILQQDLFRTEMGLISTGYGAYLYNQDTYGNLQGWVVGSPPTSSFYSLNGYHDTSWFLDAPVTDDEAELIVVNGYQVPWTPPVIPVLDHDVRVAVADERNDFPKTRELAVGATVGRHPADRLCQRARVRVEGWRAGRPWCLNGLDLTFDPSGPFGSKRGNSFPYEHVNAGLYRSPGEKPPGALQDQRNVVHTKVGPRRRRGFEIREDVDATTPYGANSFHSWRSLHDELFMAIKAGDTLYSYLGSGAVTALSTGWGSSSPVNYVHFNNTCAVLGLTKRELWDGSSSTREFGVAAPPFLSSQAYGAGLLAGTYYYAVTYYDSDTGDETGPIVTTSSISPVNQQALVRAYGFGHTSFLEEHERFDKMRVYRSTNGGSPPKLFYIGQMDIGGSTYTDYYDNAPTEGTEIVDQVSDTDETLLGYVTMELPADFLYGVAHKGRVFYTDGSNRVYWSESDSLDRFYSGSFLRASGPITALVSHQGRLVLFTRRTVELVESDWVRDQDSNVEFVRTVLTEEVGCVGSHAAKVYGSRLAWFDNGGIFTLSGQDAVELTKRVDDYFPYVNVGQASQITLAYNPIDKNLWLTLPLATQDDNTRLQTQLVQDPSDPEKWSVFDLEAAHVAAFDDDLDGMKFGLIDHIGVFKELGASEGDGIKGDETITFEDEGDDLAIHLAGISAISGATVTVYGSPAWTTDALRGMSVVMRVRLTGELYGYTILTNTADAFTCERAVSSDLGDGDGYYIGAVGAYMEFAASGLGSANRKVIRQAQYELVDLTQTDLYL